MAKVTKKMYLLAVRYTWSEETTFSIEAYPGSVGQDGGSVVVREFEVEQDAPEGFDPRLPIAEAMQAYKRKLMAETQAVLTQVDAGIQSMLALPMSEQTQENLDDLPF